MTVTVDAMPLAGLVELVNGWGTVPREARAEDGGEEAYPPIAAQAGVPPEAAGVLTDQAMAHIADRLHPIFATSGAAEQVRLVNELLAETGVRPILSMEEDQPRLGWIVGGGKDAVLAAGAVALRQYLADHRSDRLGVCTGRRCADVYIDTSPAGRRRFCSLTCQNRARVAAFRSRRARSGSSRT
ncbi:CGNR zinc finger domain-containing protein [Nonomuraea zeae]|uniref:Zinc finger CGNR domain-containing protein n=1 Tax=Nonomuraea zeae TaxID=1642303 RepID=A0A5S4H3X4_9ACTN|nr:CGNR zinc finger domain-containing protein [Nonomuraea zeae]TMR39807.1 hypothetical protein ETD85_00040 [Nonomuraea zeae]